ncbi:hypothetical protein BXZ70DRAFT_911252 [Cristinia sonorae]|uniref:Uncharacterized protein n=1 Tax=Cristinia sonorae TaxID=1940300 RepID=A0A8K0UFU7_9AGAR|nr:hypothetical protein BXZ70DRAFT_911252 [Cristinia sonorae]
MVRLMGGKVARGEEVGLSSQGSGHTETAVASSSQPSSSSGTVVEPYPLPEYLKRWEANSVVILTDSEGDEEADMNLGVKQMSMLVLLEKIVAGQMVDSTVATLTDDRSSTALLETVIAGRMDGGQIENRTAVGRGKGAASEAAEWVVYVFFKTDFPPISFHLSESKPLGRQWDEVFAFFGRTRQKELIARWDVEGWMYVLSDNLAIPTDKPYVFLCLLGVTVPDTLLFPFTRMNQRHPPDVTKEDSIVVQSVKLPKESDVAQRRRLLAIKRYKKAMGVPMPRGWPLCALPDAKERVLRELCRKTGGRVLDEDVIVRSETQEKIPAWRRVLAYFDSAQVVEKWQCVEHGRLKFRVAMEFVDLGEICALCEECGEVARWKPNFPEPVVIFIDHMRVWEDIVRDEETTETDLLCVSSLPISKAVWMVKVLWGGECSLVNVMVQVSLGEAKRMLRILRESYGRAGSSVPGARTNNFREFMLYVWYMDGVNPIAFHGVTPLQYVPIRYLRQALDFFGMDEFALVRGWDRSRREWSSEHPVSTWHQPADRVIFWVLSGVTELPDTDIFPLTRVADGQDIVIENEPGIIMATRSVLEETELAKARYQAALREYRAAKALVSVTLQPSSQSKRFRRHVASWRRDQREMIEID